MKTTPFHEGRHLPTESLIDATDRCRACGSTRPRRPVFRIQRSPRVELLKCGWCGIASASMMPTDAALDAYYGAYYDHGKPQHTFDNVERFGRHVAAYVSGHFERVRILDFGGGDGALAVAVAQSLLDSGRARSAQLLVVDPCLAGESSDPRIELATASRLTDATGAFDVLIASAVFEHLPEVGDALRQFFALGAPGATYYARTPYWEPMMRRLPNVDMTFPAHVHDIGPEFWNRVHTTLGLSLLPVASRPSIVETAFSEAPLRTAAAYLLKAPSLIEVAVRPAGWERPWWSFVGGWEVALTATGDA